MRPHIEMQAIDLESGWIPLEGFPGLDIKVIANDLNENDGTGARTRFVRFAAGAQTDRAFVHTYWEEFYLVQGDLFLLEDPEKSAMSAPVYSLRPPGTPHGPMGSKNGAIAFEVQYFVK